MADRSKIEWTDASWNPVRARDRQSGREGWICVHASPGCERCYAERINLRLGSGLEFVAQNAGRLEAFVAEDTLREPLRWRKPRRIFVCSMTDLFGDFVSDRMIARVLAVSALAPHHTFLLLTKRSARMRRLLNDDQFIEWVGAEVSELERSTGRRAQLSGWPLPNVWLGVSVEDRRRLIERAPALLELPAAVRFLSVEPLLESLRGQLEYYLGDVETDNNGPVLHGIDWVIVGGESGPGARPFELEWAAEIIDACRAAGAACFIKQIGSRPQLKGERLRIFDAKGGDLDEWPQPLRIRQWPDDRDLFGGRA